MKEATNMEERISIREWQKRYKAGEYNSKARSVQCEAGWYDWFCKDEGLLGRLKRLAPLILGITVPEVLDNYYLWLKNNCEPLLLRNIWQLPARYADSF